MISPFWKRVVVPHLPEESADQCANGKRDDCAPIPVAQLFEKIRSPGPVINRLENKDQRRPYEWIEKLWPDEHCQKHQKANDEHAGKGCGCRPKARTCV